MTATEAERLIWRIKSPSFQIEPYLQRRTASGWSKGRLLALKHLLPGGEQRGGLPPEDERVAAYVREERQVSYGYPETWRFIDSEAWPVLIGHPRVYLGDDDTPTEVAAGTVHLVAKTRDDQFCLTIEPSDLPASTSVRLEGQRLVVYAVDDALLKVRQAVGTGIVVPSDQRERLVRAAARLTHLVPLHSNEPASADTLQGDATPCLRILPRSGGLTVALRVRPCGELGPALAPGRGAPLLLAHVAGKPVQATRDLALELRRAAEVIEACAVGRLWTQFDGG